MNITLIGGSGNLGKNLYLSLSKYKKIKNILVIDNKQNLIKKKNFIKIDLSQNKLEKKKIELFRKKKIDLAFILAFDLNFKKANKNYINTGKKVLNNSLNLCKLGKVKKIVYFSSFAVYGEKKKLITERSLPKPLNIYGKLKLICEKKINKFCSKKKIKFIILRISQVYGHGITSSIIGKFHQFKKHDKEITIINNGNQYRDYVFIDDFVDLIKKIVNFNFNKNYTLNMCRGKKTKTFEIVKLLKLRYINLIKKNEIKFLLGDNSLIKKTLKWNAKTSLKAGIKKIIKYEKNYRNK